MISNSIKNIETFAKRKGRRIVVNGVQWVWKLGAGNNVLAYNEFGDRKCEHASRIKGVTPDEWDRGQWKKCSRLLPSEISKWLGTVELLEVKKND